MKTVMSGHYSPSGNHLLRKSFAPLAATCVLMSLTQGITAGELLTNGQFDQVLVGWTVSAELDPWLPYLHPQGTIKLHPDTGAYAGTLISQSLNVGGIAGQTVTGSIDLGSGWALPPGNSVAVYLEYLDDTGALQRHKLINPDNASIPAATTATFTGIHTFPPSAVKLVRLAIDKEGYGEAYADNLTLTSPTLTPGAVPHLGGLTPARAGYGQSVTLAGSGFGGATPPEVLLNGGSAGLTVTGWTDTTISLTVDTPAASGPLSVKVAGTPSCERSWFEVTSPHCQLSLQAGIFHTVPGQSVEVPVWVAFRNGFAPPAGVQFQVMKDTTPIPVVAAPALTREGGSMLTIDPANLTAGQNHLAIRPSGGDFTGVDSFFDVFVEIPMSARLSLDGTVLTDTLKLTKQGQSSLTVEILDAGGSPITTVPPLTWSSTNPAACDVYFDPSPWGGALLLANNDGNATIMATGPNGFQFTLAVQVDVPESPRMIACDVGSNPMTNSGTVDNTLFVQLDTPVSGYSSWGASGMTIELGNTSWNEDRTSMTGTFTTKPGAAPGIYLMNANMNGQTRYAKVAVINDPAKGMLSGRVVAFGGGEEFMHQEIMGTMEFYDATSGVKVTPGAGDGDLEIMEFGSPTYHAPYLDPGVYKVRWLPQMPGGNPQWWPNAASFEEASAVTVVAGAELPGIHFFLGPQAKTPPVIAGPPSFNPANGTFTISIQTESNVNYQLQRTDSLAGGTWFNVGDQVWGDGSVLALRDTTANGAKAFYRVLRK